MLDQMDDEIESQVTNIRTRLLDWFAVNRRDLPWRLTRDPYRILVSEVMLQQTQVDRVVPYFNRWLERFPTVRDLASAPTSEVIELWSGLGYNRRAINLQRAATAVVDQFDGRFPTSVLELRRLPGIGPYTAGAICAFAFELDVAFLDTNIRRVIHRLFEGSDYPVRTAADDVLLDHAQRLVGHGFGWAINQALIEFGALHCTQRRPACVTCPLQADCRAYPRIQTAIAEVPRGTRLKNEGSFEGSNRQFRGRVLRYLQKKDSVSLAELGPEIKPAFTESDLPWLLALVNGLRRDGLVRMAETGEEYVTSKPVSALIVSLPE